MQTGKNRSSNDNKAPTMEGSAPVTEGAIPQAPTTPGDIARWLFWVQLRRVLPVSRPGLIRTVYPLWWLQYLSAGPRRSLMADELRRTFGRADEAMIRDAYRIAFRVHFEELLLGKLTAENYSRYMTFDGREHLDAALARGKGAIILLPHAGNVMMMIAAVSLAGYKYTQYAARGLAPDAVAQQFPDVFGHNRWRKEAREAREANENRLPARFLTMETPLREMFRSLERNEVVGFAYDGRIGGKFVKVPYLGREALLSPGAYRMAARTGAAIVPTFCSCPDDGPNICHFSPPIFPEGRSAEQLMAQFVTEEEKWIRRFPETYGIWLLHCRMRPDVDDHPFFIDYAPDDRWKKHLRD